MTSTDPGFAATASPAAPSPPPGRRPSRTRFHRGLLFFSVIFAVLLLLDVALVGNLIFRDLSQRVINEARVRSQQEAQNIARQLAEGGFQATADIYRVVQSTRLFARYLDRVLQKYTVIQQIEIVNSAGETVFSKARRADVLAREQANPGSGGLPAPPENGDSLEFPRPAPEEPGKEDPAVALLTRLGIPVPATQLGPDNPAGSIAIRGAVSGSFDVTVPLPDQDGFVKVSLSQDELAREIEELRRDLILKIMVGAVLSLILIVVAYVFVVKLFNKTRRLEAEAQMADRLAYVGTLAAGLAHEIRNPLSAMKLNLQLLEAGQEDGHPPGTDAEAEELLRETRQEVDRLGDLVTSFLSYARPPRLELAPADLNRVVEETVHFLRADATKRQVHLELELSSSLPHLSLDGKQLRQALLNILRNAIAALESQGGGTVRVISARHGNGGVQVAVEDDGPGIPPERLASIFQVFYSARPGGTGLGLPIAQRVVEGHGGHIEVESAPGSGTRFTLIFPRPLPVDSVKAAL